MTPFLPSFRSERINLRFLIPCLHSAALKTCEELIIALEQCVEDAKDRKLTVRDTIDRLEEGSYAFLCLLFTIPFLQPISL